MLHLQMLTHEEEKFLLYWEKNRLKKKDAGIISLGTGVGLFIGIGILLNYISGWYSRADMVANSQSTPFVLIIAILIITIFCGFFYNKYRWDMNEQRFLELKSKKESENSYALKQHTDDNNSQVSN